MAKYKRRPLRPSLPRKSSRPLPATGRQSTSTPGLPKRSVAHAHEKHSRAHSLIPADPAAPPTLADRFHALPGELRNLIFAFVLVQPAKWDLTHAPACPLRRSSGGIEPSNSGSHSLTCAECYWHGPSNHRWGEGKTIWMSPWRSKWAPEQTNPYLCTTCYDARWRPRPFPQTKSLPCLCARQQGLEVLLVCQRWYREAGCVFYHSNTFCFEDSTTFVSFVSNLSPQWRRTITRVSLMAFHPLQGEIDEEGGERGKAFRPVCFWMRQLPNLTRLELDGEFLTRPGLVSRLMKLGLIRTKIHFALRRPERLSGRRSGNQHIWPAFARRLQLRGGFPEEVARAMNGQRRLLLRGGGKHIRSAMLEHAVEGFRALVKGLEEAGSKIWWVGDPADCSDAKEWERLWYQIGYHHAYFPLTRSAKEAAVESEDEEAQRVWRYRTEERVGDFFAGLEGW